MTEPTSAKTYSDQGARDDFVKEVFSPGDAFKLHTNKNPNS